MKFIATTALVVATLLLSVSSVDGDVRDKEGDSKNKRSGRVGSTVASHHAARAEKIAAHEKTTTTANYNPSIVGGTEAKIGQYPYYVDLGECGGVLIARNVVLTVAHCKGERVDRTNVVVGTVKNLKWDSSFKANSTSPARSLQVEKEVIHPNFTFSTLENDISLLLLNDTYCLPDEYKLYLNADASFPPDGEALTVMGTGRTFHGGWVSDTLEHVEVDATNCTAHDPKKIFESSLCAWRDGKDACNEDGGGPLVKEFADGSHLLVGLVIWNKGCAHSEYPSVYTRVSSYTQWIEKTVCEDWGVEATFCGQGYSKACSPCVDDSAWHDSRGPEYNCPFYASELSNCAQYGEDYSNFGKTANVACCECKRQPYINYCDTEWKDTDGDDCKWFSDNGYLGDPIGWLFKNETGVPANMACCG